MRRGPGPLVAVVRLRKRNDWVLPKGKLDGRETPREAAEREVLEETGHEVVVHEFVGTLAYDSRGRSKVVHFWRMEADDEQTLPLMNDIRAVDWLPLEAAIERLSRSYEQVFLSQVGPIVLEAALRSAVSDHRPPAVAAATSVADEAVTQLVEAPSLVSDEPPGGRDSALVIALRRLRGWWRGDGRD